MLASLSGQTEAATQQRMQALEARLLELESRLADAEQETQQVKVIAENSNVNLTDSTYQAARLNLLAGKAWRDLRWMQASQWKTIRKGISEEQVVGLLGVPPRSVKSAKPRVDEVFYYETSIRDTVNSVRGKISFKGGKVIAYQKPDFEKVRAMR